MKSKKIVAGVVASFMAVSLLSGCTGGGDKNNDTAKTQTAGAKPNEIKTYTMYVGDTNYPPTDFSETPIGKKVTELTGVKLKIEYITGNEQSTKAGVMIASGDYPDLIHPHNQTAKFLEAGAFVPIEGYIEKLGENTKKWYKGQLNKLKQTDGHTYYLSDSRETPEVLYPNAGFWLPIAVLKDAGYPKVTTFEKYVEIIRNYVKKNPEYNGKPTIGFTAITDGWRFFTLRNAPGMLMGNPNDGDFAYVDRTDYTSKTFANNEFAKKYYKTLNELWHEGLVDKEMFTQNYDQYVAKISQGRVIGFYDQRWQFLQGIQALEKQNQTDRVHIGMPVVFDGVKTEAYMEPIAMDQTKGIAISKNCKDPEGAFKFLDSLLREDALKLMKWGIEGVDYTMKDGKMTKSLEQFKQMEEREYQVKQGISVNYFPRPARGADVKFSDGTPIDPRDTKEYLETKYKDYEKEILKAYKINSFVDLFNAPIKSPIGKAYSVTIPSGSPAAVAKTKIDDEHKRLLPKMITGPKDQFEANWKEFVSAIEKIDMAAYNKARTDAYQQRLKDWKE